MTAINPKQLDADNKLPMGLFPEIVKIRVCAVFREGARRVGRWIYNWRDNPVNLTTYLDAAERHISAIRSGEDIDPVSGEPHWACASANLAIIGDAEHVGTLIDDRPKVRGNTAQVLRDYETRYRKQAAEIAPVYPALIDSITYTKVSTMPHDRGTLYVGNKPVASVSNKLEDYAQLEDGKDCGARNCTDAGCNEARAARCIKATEAMLFEHAPPVNFEDF